MNVKVSKKKVKKYSQQYVQDERACYIMLLPQIIGFCAFTVIPLAWAISLAWTHYDMITTRFVGFENFKILLKDQSYWKVLGNTLLYAVMKIPVELPIALLLAVLMNRKLKFKGFYRGVFYLPHVISIALIALTFSNLFSYFGVINSWLLKLGFTKEPVAWFEKKYTSMWVIVLADIWHSFGVNVLYFIAALANVPEDVYESARLDGAGPVRIFFGITIPMIKPVLQVILMMSIIGTLHINEMIVVLTNGAPGGSTFSVMSYIFQNYAPGLTAGSINIGYGCAMSLVTGIILAVITGIYMKFSEKMKEV